MKNKKTNKLFLVKGDSFFIAQGKKIGSLARVLSAYLPGLFYLGVI